MHHSHCYTLNGYRYVFAKSTASGLTRFYALRVNSADNTAVFEYRPEGLDEGFRTLAIPGLNLTGDDYHHLGISVYGTALWVYLNGRLHHQTTLTGALEDGVGVISLGGIPTGNAFYSGMSSTYYPQFPC